MEKTEKIFVDGLYFEAPSEIMKEKTPWIKGKISIKVPALIPFLQKHEQASGYVNINLCKSQKGSLYLELNTWQPKKEISETEAIDNYNSIKSPDEVIEKSNYPTEEIDAEDIPF